MYAYNSFILVDLGKIKFVDGILSAFTTTLLYIGIEEQYYLFFELIWSSMLWFLSYHGL